MTKAEARGAKGTMDPIGELVDRYEPAVFDARKPVTRIRVAVTGGGQWDVLIANEEAKLVPISGTPDAVLTASAQTWRHVATDLRNGMDAYNSGQLTVRRNLHAGVGFLAATAQEEEGRLRFVSVPTEGHRLSIMDAGNGPTVVALHGLGATKGSFLPTLSAMADDFRVIAVDLPGFGDSDKPIGAAYDAAFFADAIVDLMDALELDRVNLLGNSLGGRVALEIGLRHPMRVNAMGLLAPSLAWRRGRPLQPLVRLARPELGCLQVAPRALVEGLLRRVIPDAEDGWPAVGVDEFLRAYLTRSGRAAFYAAARQIYLEEPHGEQGFWTRLEALEPDALCIWGRQDRIVPLAFARHVTAALPHSRHVELECGHVPQVERPVETHAALAEFFEQREVRRGRITAQRRSAKPAAAEYADLKRSA